MINQLPVRGGKNQKQHRPFYPRLLTSSPMTTVPLRLLNLWKNRCMNHSFYLLLVLTPLCSCLPFPPSFHLSTLSKQMFLPLSFPPRLLSLPKSRCLNHSLYPSLTSLCSHLSFLR